MATSRSTRLLLWIVAVGVDTSVTSGEGLVEITTTDAIDSGNSRRGHEGARYGTDLPEADKDAILEYVKSL